MNIRPPRWLDRLLIRVIVRLANRQPDLVDHLTRLESGVAIYCARSAISSPTPALKKVLTLQAETERQHAIAMSRLSALPYPPGYHLKHEAWGQVGTGTRHPYDADGISQRYPLAIAYFGGVKPHTLPVPDQLAMMSVLEWFQCLFYERLAQTRMDALGVTAGQIAREEFNHSQTLLLGLATIANNWEALNAHWHWQVYRAISQTLWKEIYAAN